jgi:hypothetical protein
MGADQTTAAAKINTTANSLFMAFLLLIDDYSKPMDPAPSKLN